MVVPNPNLAPVNPMTESLLPTPRKQCSCCKEKLPLRRFGRNRQARDGLHYYCKECAAKRQRGWAKNNSEIVRRMRNDYRKRMCAANATRDPYETEQAA